MFAKDLTAFGLSEKEVEVYTTLLELEVASASEISKKSGINRSSVYVVLDSLKEKGLIGSGGNDSVREYVATNPDIFMRMAETDFERAHVNVERIKDIIPELKALHKDTKKKPHFFVFEGMGGLVNALEEMLNAKEKIVRFCTSSELLMKAIPDYIKEHGTRRIATGIQAHAILPDTKWSRELIDAGPHLIKTAIMPVKSYKFPTDFSIFDDKVGYMFAQNETMITTIIQSREIAEVMKKMFDMTWEEAARVGRTEVIFDK